ncbi:MAG: bifunctional metallophosphatase/5'-nucleotidase [Bacteroidota bacterium]
MAEFQFQDRRSFLKYVIGSSFALSSLNGLSANILNNKDLTKLVILYTNDQHSRIEPFPDNDPKFSNQGGFARRAAVINKIRSVEQNVLLLDAGDIFQGTPYFNLYKGEVEYKLMSLMGYDCVTLGNHDFDLGMENISKQMEHAKFDFVCANYSFSDTPLENRIHPFKIYKKGGLKIGIFGLGIELQGLVPEKLYGNTRYYDPVIKANETAYHLKLKRECDFVICLSHLGYKYDDKKISDLVLAEKSANIDLIIGGHTHTFLEKSVEVKNSMNKIVHITQVGWGGIWLGRMEIVFLRNPKFFSIESQYYKIIKNQV